MIEMMQGVVRRVKPGYIVLDVKGICYKLTMSLRDTDTVKLYPEHYQYFFVIEQTTMNGSIVVRRLYGFRDERERDLVQLIADKVQGIGLSTAMKIFNSLSGVEFKQAVSVGNEKAIQCKGIGVKNSKNIVQALDGYFKSELSVTEPKNKVPKAAIDDAVSTLVALGYKKQEAMDSISKVVNSQVAGPENIDAQFLVKLAMKK